MINDISNMDVNRYRCLMEANKFFDAVCILDEKSLEFHDDILAPYGINLTFACELYLKYLLYPHVSNKKIKEHNLSKLFDKLEFYAKDTADEINQAYCSEYPDCHPFYNLHYVLKINGNNFIDLRYSYECDKCLKVHSTDLGSLVRVLKRICNKK